MVNFFSRMGAALIGISFLFSIVCHALPSEQDPFQITPLIPSSVYLSNFRPPSCAATTFSNPVYNSCKSRLGLVPIKNLESKDPNLQYSVVVLGPSLEETTNFDGKLQGATNGKHQSGTEERAFLWDPNGSTEGAPNLPHEVLAHLESPTHQQVMSCVDNAFYAAKLSNGAKVLHDMVKPVLEVLESNEGALKVLKDKTTKAGSHFSSGIAQQGKVMEQALNVVKTEGAGAIPKLGSEAISTMTKAGKTKAIALAVFVGKAEDFFRLYDAMNGLAATGLSHPLQNPGKEVKDGQKVLSNIRLGKWAAEQGKLVNDTLAKPPTSKTELVKKAATLAVGVVPRKPSDKSMPITSAVDRAAKPIGHVEKVSKVGTEVSTGGAAAASSVATEHPTLELIHTH